ncbi:MAG: ankyrin repeat domain-containing protein [bacterium]|nr:ankyrin repeat domain-containing protein [bacterium]
MDYATASIAGTDTFFINGRISKYNAGRSWTAKLTVAAGDKKTVDIIAEDHGNYTPDKRTKDRLLNPDEQIIHAVRPKDTIGGPDYWLSHDVKNRYFINKGNLSAPDGAERVECNYDRTVEREYPGNLFILNNKIYVLSIRSYIELSAFKGGEARLFRTTNNQTIPGTMAYSDYYGLITIPSNGSCPMSICEDTSPEAENAGLPDKRILALRERLRDIEQDASMMPYIEDMQDIIPQCTELFVTELKNGDAKIRRSCARGLGLLGADAVTSIPNLIVALSDEGVNYIASTALARIGTVSMPSLIEALNVDGSAPYAARSLGMIGPEAAAAVPVLIEKLSAWNRSLQWECINALGNIGNASVPAVPLLAKFIEDSGCREEAISALGKIGTHAKETALPFMLDLLKTDKTPSSTRVCIVESMVKMGAIEEALPELMNMLRDKDPANGCKAQEYLIKGGEKFVPAMLDAMSSSDRLILSRAIGVIGEMGSIADDAVPVLLKILHGNDTVLKYRAARALGKIGPSSYHAIPELMVMLNSVDWFERVVAAEALGKIGSAAMPAVDMLIKRLNDNSADKRAEAALDLGRMGTTASKAVSVLMRCLSDKDTCVRIRAVEALRKINPQSDNAIHATVDLLDDEDEWLRYHVIENIREIGPPACRAICRLNDLLKEAKQEEFLSSEFMKKRINAALQAIGPSDDMHGYHVAKYPLIEAACDGDVKRILSLIDQGYDINVKDSRNWTPLFYAIDRRQLKAAAALIDHGADVNIRSVKGYTPLLYASVRGDAGMIPISGRDEIYALLAKLLSKGADPNVIAKVDGGYEMSYKPMDGGRYVENCAIRRGDTALTATIRRGHAYLAELLLSNGADPNLGRVKGRDALLWAIGKNMQKTALLLIEKGASLNTRDEYDVESFGRTPLLLAITKSEAITAAMIEKGVDIKSADRNGNTPLKYAVKEGCWKAFELLVKHGALEVDGAGPMLMEVTRRNGLEMAKAVLDTGQSVNIHDDDRVTPLILAVKNSNMEMVKLFLERGADVKAMDKSGQTALSIAIEKENREIVNLLEKAGATR